MLLGLDAFQRLAAHVPGRWLPWLAKACLAAGVAFIVGMATLGLPGGVFVELVTGLGRKVPPDGAWPLAIEVTAVGSLLIVPASLVVRLVRPSLVGWGHAWATASVAFVATALFTLYASSDRSSSAQQGPEMLTSLVAFDIAPEAPRIAVGSGPHRFTLHFTAGSARSVLLFSSPSDIDGMMVERNAQPGQPLKFDARYSGPSFLNLYPGDHVLIRNTNGYFMQLKIVSATSKGYEGDTGDSVIFEYQINEGKWPGFSAL
jgi:hypothetical protein